MKGSKGNVLITLGSSAGHLYPALALAESLALKKPALTIAFVCSKRAVAIENCILAARHRIFFISICPFSLHFLKLLKAAYQLFRSFLESFFIIQRFSPDIVIGFGSYISFPILFEAAIFRKPTLLHEQNVVLGLANKLLSPFVDKIAVSFKETLALDAKFVFTGNPLRKSLREEGKERARGFFNLENKFTLLIAGGSQGSHRINKEFQKSARVLINKKEDFQFIHITGKNDYSDLKEGYKYITIRHCVFDFLPQMHLAYSLADLVISRAGAGTIAELAYFRKAAILIPYLYAGAHQLKNALTLKKKEAAMVIEESGLNEFILSENILRLMHRADERKKMEDNIQEFANPDAAEKLAELALSLVKKGDRQPF